MDPLSVASGVAGLVTLAEVVISRTYNTIITCKHASEDSRKLLREVQALSGILQSLVTLETKLGAAALQSQIPAAQVHACQTTLQNIREKLEKADPKEDGISFVQRAKRTLRWPISASETNNFLDEMERHKSTFDLALSVDALDAMIGSQQAGIMASIKIDEVVHTLDKLWRVETTKEHRRLLHLLGAEDADEAYHMNAKLHQYGTGLWFLEEGKPYKTWLATLGAKLWVYGIPGAGKTVLSALAIQHTMRSASITHGIAFYYCSHRVDSSRQLPGILKCLIGQLARQSSVCMTVVEEEAQTYDDMSFRAWDLREDELRRILRKMLRLFQSISIIVDGVDECHDPATVTEALTSIAGESHNVRLLIFSRHEADIEPFLNDFHQISIAAESQDLRLYVPAEIEKRTRLRKLRIQDPDVKDEIVEKLVNGADGMFRWVTCQLDHLCNLTSDGERLAALKQMPRTLETTYDRILERVLERGESAAALVERTLHWLFEARPMALSTRQLCEAVSIDIGATSLDSRDLRDIQEILINCSSLVRLSVDGSRLESAHFTVEEYLRSINCVQKPSLSRFLWTATRADTYKSEVCLTALNFDTFDTDLTSDEDLIFAKLRKLPFYIHAVQFCCYKNVDYSSPAFMRLTRRLFCSPRRRNFGNWRQLFVYHWGEDEDHFLGQWCDSISTFTAYGEEKSLGHDADLPIKGLEGGEVREDSDQHKTAWIRARVVSAHTTELHFAAMCHLTPLFKILLDQSCQINYHGSLGTPLHCALASGELLLSVFARRELLMVHFRRLLIEEDLTEFRIALRALISLGADVNIDFCPLGQRRWTTTLIALHAGELNEVIRAGAVLDTDVANLLMRDTKLLQDLTCLELVDISLVSKSDRSAVEKLLEQYKQPKYVDAHNVSQSIAISKDEQEKLFERYEEAIWDACWDDDLHVFQWILEFSDFSVDRPIRGGSFLGFACEAESANIVEYLLAHGAKTDNVEEAAGLAPSGRLFHRAERFNERTLRILQLLLASKVNISIATGSGDSILMRWASVEFENNLDLNPLTNALELLLAHGSDTAHRNRSDECVWHSLARNPKGHHLARLLASRLDADADSISVALELFDSSGQTPLHLAFSLGHPDTARVLLERGSCVSRKTLDGKTVLHLAADSLELSPNAFHLALDFGWSPDDAAFNYPDMFYYCVEKLCENHNIATPGMPVCMRDIMRLFPAWTETITSEFSVKCLNKLARWLKRSECYLPGDCYEKPGDCTACAARLNCFLALFHELQAHEKQIQSDFAWFKTLCRCTSTKPACLEAIFAVLRSALPVPFLEELVQESYTLNLATFLQDERLFHALLDLQSDVDRRFGQKKDHSFLQRLCRNGAPTSVVEKALIRAKRADVCTPHGDSLLHLCFRSKKTPTIFRKTTVDLLIEKGVNINLRSGYDGMTALMCSAKRSSTTALQSLLLHQADPNLRDHGGYNALSHACESGAHECVRILFNSACPIVFLQKNISPIQPYQSLWCGPLQLAALSGSLQTFEALEELAPFSELSRPDLKSPSVLWVACGTEKTKTALSVVKHLLAQGSDVNYREPSGGTTPLHIASAAGSLECVKLLLEHGSHPAVTDHRGLTAKMYALARGHQEVVRIFASDLGPISSATGIITAPTYRTERLRPHDTLPDLFYGHVAYGDLKALKNLNVDHEGLDLSMSYHSCGCTPMTTALETGQTSVVMYLLNLNVHTRGPDCAVHPASRFPTLGLMAAQPCMLEPLEELLKQCLVVSPALLNYAAHTAAVCGNITALKMLLAAGCPLERPNDTRQLRELGICFLTWTGDWDHIAYIDGSLLLTAVSLQQDRSATVLLDHGFDADALESSGDTVLHTAARMGFVSMLDLLLAKGAHIDVRSADMSTPLITAAAADCSYAVRYFLYRGADMWLTNVHGNSACAASARSGSLDCFMILKSAGSEVRLSDISALYAAGHRTSLMVDDFAQRAVADQDFWTLHSAYLTIPILRMGTLSQRRRNLIVPCTSLRGANHLYVSAAAGHLEKLKLLLGAGATLNLEGGPEGTPLMAACKFGRLDIVRLLVRNGALLGYSKDAKHFSAFAKASSHPKIQRWLLVERFIEQRKITVGVLANVEKAPKVEDDTDTEDIADITLDLVLAEEVEQYLESKNWFLPMRRFIDSGEGAFDKVPILPAEFARYRPKGYHSAP